MKKLSLVLLVLIIGSVSVFAAGQVESDDGAEYSRPFRQSPPDLEEDTITVTGTLKLTLSGHPELIAGGTTWQLQYPMYLADGLEIEDGTTITVEGIEGEYGYGPRFGDSDEENVLHVVRAEINGTEYDLSEYMLQGGGRMAFDAPRGGMPGRGPMAQNSDTRGPGSRFDDDRDDDRGRFDSRRSGRR